VCSSDLDFATWVVFYEAKGGKKSLP
jgi:hypothetical protein